MNISWIALTRGRIKSKHERSNKGVYVCCQTTQAKSNWKIFKSEPELIGWMKGTTVRWLSRRSCFAKTAVFRPDCLDFAGILCYPFIDYKAAFRAPAPGGRKNKQINKIGDNHYGKNQDS